MATTSKKNVTASKKKAVSKKPAKAAANKTKQAESKRPPAVKPKKDVPSPAVQVRKVSKSSAQTGTAKLTGRDKLIQDIRKQLLEQKAILMAGAEATRTGLPDDETYPDLGDQATAESDRSFLLRLRSRESKLIKKIDDTIELIDKGEYGICEECGEEIDERRLIARPVTTFCIECKTRQEEDEKLR